MPVRGRRVVFTAKNEVTVEDFEVPPPKPNEVLIETKKTLISSGTELASLEARSSSDFRGEPKFPKYPGYSHTGVVAQVGSAVKEFREGDAVYCQSRHASYGLATIDRNLCKIPEGVSFEEAAFTTLAAVALYGVRRAQIQLGEWVMVLGLGVVGQLSLQLARLCGAVRTIGVDLYSKRLEVAEESGCSCVIDAAKTDLALEIKNIVCQDGVDVVIDATGAPNAILPALQCLRKRGRVVITGSPHGSVTIPNLFEAVCQRDITVIGTLQPNNPHSANMVYRWSQLEERKLLLQLLRDGLLRVKHLISHQIPAENAAEAYAILQRNPDKALGVILDWT